MNLSSMVTDNITELLVKILEFTRSRQRILAGNINNMHKPDFMPLDLAVDDFAGLLHKAMDEHLRSRRLVLCDTENIRFGTNGSFELKPMIDTYALQLLEESPDRYLELQVNRLLENSLNQRVAAQLLRQKVTDRPDCFAGLD